MRLTEERRMLRKTAREFAQRELAPYAADWDREARFPKEALAELGWLGFLGMLASPEYGGAGAWLAFMKTGNDAAHPVQRGG